VKKIFVIFKNKNCEFLLHMHNDLIRIYNKFILLIKHIYAIDIEYEILLQKIKTIS